MTPMKKLSMLVTEVMVTTWGQQSAILYTVYVVHPLRCIQNYSIHIHHTLLSLALTAQYKILKSVRAIQLGMETSLWNIYMDTYGGKLSTKRYRGGVLFTFY